MSDPQSAPNPVTETATLAKTPIGSPEDVHRLIGGIEHIMDALDEVLGAETELLKEGKLQEALELVEAKNQLSIQYMLLQKAITSNVSLIKDLSPNDTEQLNRRHQMFQNTLQANLAVVSTAREVSAELVNGINEQVQKGARANTYGNKGRMPQAVTQKRGLSINKSS
ncbi:hypothetical protein SAMN04515647_4597 [Cohaesibacter sp. ES.047]|uniref:hypothetical protein n=1 Tax=Cohaesibacter sp. ES.047 TaxID=1798205 RepID=UPI000BB695C8|nr:hypothetical protein [Cohaesibacter sp. ES.047]SNY94275.1 hypothetical protein SAMN04515647_4597 [Cohaesibacter sp. ES.047]